MNERRLVLVQNPNSTRATKIEQQVHTPLAQAGISYERFTTRSPQTEDNIADMRQAFRDGDTILSAGGDGTAMQVANAVLRSGLKDVRIGFLPYGNFNDLAKSHASTNPVDLVTSDTTVDHHPLTLFVNGEYERDTPSYITLGWTAIAAAQFGNLESREKMKSSPELMKLGRSLMQLAGNYFENRHTMLPEHTVSHSPLVQRAVSDVIAINSPRVGGIVKSSRDYFDTSSFGYAAVDVSKIIPNIPFGLKALAGHTPAMPVNELSLRFATPATLPFQSEGEFKQLEDVRELQITKDPSRVLHVIKPSMSRK